MTRLLQIEPNSFVISSPQLILTRQNKSVRKSSLEHMLRSQAKHLFCRIGHGILLQLIAGSARQHIISKALYHQYESHKNQAIQGLKGSSSDLKAFACSVSDC